MCPIHATLTLAGTLMPIAFRCACGTPLKVKDALAGKKVKCPKCGTSLAVPEAGYSPDDEVVDVRDCPSCGEMLASDAVICIGCGHDFRSGQKAASKKASKASKSQSAEDLVESVLGYSGRVKKKKRTTGPLDENWKRLRIALLVTPILALVVAAIGCPIINAQPAESERRIKAFGVVGLVGLLAVVMPASLFLRELGELNRAHFGATFQGPYWSKAIGLSTVSWLISLGLLFGAAMVFAPP
jgi:DNA-directed RNA polymerase subunit M/transcription elongation factor TFIIS